METWPGKMRGGCSRFLEKLGARLLKADNYRCTRWSLRRGAEVGGCRKVNERRWPVAFNLEHTRELVGTDNERDRCSLPLCAPSSSVSGTRMKEMEKTGWTRFSENGFLNNFWRHPVGLGWSTIRKTTFVVIKKGLMVSWIF